MKTCDQLLLFTPLRPSPRLSKQQVAWKKKEGDSVQPGDVLCEVETDKVRCRYTASWLWVRRMQFY